MAYVGADITLEVQESCIQVYPSDWMRKFYYCLRFARF